MEFYFLFLALPPVGIDNEDSDCYLISLATLLLNTQEFIEGVKEGSNKIYKNLVKKYHEAQIQQKTLSSNKESAFRIFKNYLIAEHSDVCKQGEVGDSGSVFQKIYKDILIATNNKWPLPVKLQVEDDDGVSFEKKHIF
ncbi:MAG: hypothetical protein KC505_04600 [Myxococcales bacterium]|nr:hypothetical protein [Myxococcales bacterium]USN50987.1 MAG: hypothetical protein H6731_00810 [Myxococcales bacterium]